MSSHVLESKGRPTDEPVYKARRVVKMGDTDASGLLHFPAVSRWVADAFESWFFELDYKLLDQLAVNHALPVVNSDISILRGIGLDHELEIEMWVAATATHSMTLRMEATDARSGDLVVAAETVHVWVLVQPADGFEAPAISKAPLPGWIQALAEKAERLKGGPAEGPPA